MSANEAMSTFTRIYDRQYLHIARICRVDVPCPLREFADSVGPLLASCVLSAVRFKADSIYLRHRCTTLTFAKFDGFEQPVASMDPNISLKDNLILCLNSADRTSMQCSGRAIHKLGKDTTPSSTVETNMHFSSLSLLKVAL